MIERLTAHDSMLQGAFMLDEVPYNLVYRVLESEEALCVKTANEQLLFAQTPGLNGWLWLSPHSTVAQQEGNLSALMNHLAGRAALTGVSGAPASAQKFADAYAARTGTTWRTHMALEAYTCEAVRQPTHVPGELRQAAEGDADTVAAFIAGFSEETRGVPATPDSQRTAALGMIATGNLYVWVVEEEPVSMANIAFRAPRHGRINAVYTPRARRSRGYASAAVAELSLGLLREGLVPMLYTDAANPISNRAYRNVGYVQQGSLVDIQFERGE
ncbi:GNAT family N-acetyltransferase [Cohnella sp. 56]|uniref:GNAT family N-acetyltransferase n=1 Tax=Cohnella sp. 56 TaxID=3113722 RepID=UPI0030E9669F